MSERATAVSAAHAMSPGQQRPFPVPRVRFDYEVVVPMSDGLGLHTNIFRPEGDAVVPAIITHGVYGKDVPWARTRPYRHAWKVLRRKVADLNDRSSLSFMRWEMPDPEYWVPRGYAVIHADARGSGKTPGTLDLMSPREIQDYKELIEWVAGQPWCTGRVGLMGISYYAITQWRVAALKPAGLAAIIPWEGAYDHYRDIAAHGGIPSRFFVRNWYQRQVAANAHGQVGSGFKDAVVGGPANAQHDDEDVPSSTIEPIPVFEAHPFDDAFHRSRTPDPEAIEVPLLSVGNWGGAGLHLRGNIEAFTAARSEHKWLRLHASDHFSPFYHPRGLALQERFLGRFLKDEDNGWEHEPRVEFLVRDPRGREATRRADAWPIPDARTTTLYLDGAHRGLTTRVVDDEATLSYEWHGPGITFRTEPVERELEIAGAPVLRLWVRPEQADMDLFVVLRLFDPKGRDVTFEGANAPRQAVAQGWLRLTHRTLDDARTRAERPYHAHREPAPVEPGADYVVEIELWPTSVIVPAGYRLALTVLGRDFVFPGWRSAFASLAVRRWSELPAVAGLLMQGSTPFLHDGRDAARFGGAQRILCGGRHDSLLRLPVV